LASDTYGLNVSTDGLYVHMERKHDIRFTGFRLSSPLLGDFDDLDALADGHGKYIILLCD